MASWVFSMLRVVQPFGMIGATPPPSAPGLCRWRASQRCWRSFFCMVAGGIFSIGQPIFCAPVVDPSPTAAAASRAVATVQSEGDMAYAHGWLGLAREAWTIAQTRATQNQLPVLEAQLAQRLAMLDSAEEEHANGAWDCNLCESLQTQLPWSLRWSLPVGANGQANRDQSQHGGQQFESVAFAATRAIVPVCESGFVLWNCCAAVHAVGVTDGRPPWRAAPQAIDSVLFPRGSAALCNGRSDRMNLASASAICVDSARAFATLVHFELPARPAPLPPAPALLVCLDLSTAAEGRLLWMAKSPPIPANAAAGFVETAFDGPPAADRSMCVVAVRALTPRAGLALAAFDARDGRLLWVKPTGQSSAAGSGDTACAQAPCFAEDRIIVASPAGSIRAFNRDGRPAWSTDTNTVATGSELETVGHKKNLLTAVPAAAPTLFSRGRIFVAAQDNRSILALDARSGRVLWNFSAPPVGAVSIVGVTANHVVALVTEAAGSGLRAFAVDSGGELARSAGAVADVQSAGRPLLVGDNVLWPTVATAPSSSDRRQVAINVIAAATLTPRGPAIFVLPSEEQVQLAAGSGALVLASSSMLFCIGSEPIAGSAGDP